MIIKCKNMTHAMKAQRILSDNKIDSSVEKINNDPAVSGCIYSVKFDDSEYKKAMSVMNMGGVILHKSEKLRFNGDTV